jgi:phytanoyl-CoA hydroxylase
MISAAEKRQYEDQGYLLKIGVLTAAECDALCAHVSATIPRVVREMDAHGGRRGDGAGYFRSTARTIGLFWERGTEPDALAPEECEQAINRLGHGLHVVDATFRRAAQHPKVADGLEALNGPGINIVQSMIIYKQPRVGGEFGFHQDAAYLHSEPNTLISAWMALDEVTEENSPLVVIPGSHRLPLNHVSEMSEDGSFHDRALSDVRPDMSAAVAVPAPRGSVIFFHGCLYHGSAANESPRPRRAYAVHYARAASRWSPFNWIDGAPGFVPLREG